MSSLPFCASSAYTFVFFSTSSTTDGSRLSSVSRLLLLFAHGQLEPPIQDGMTNDGAVSLHRGLEL